MVTLQALGFQEACGDETVFTVSFFEELGHIVQNANALNTMECSCLRD